MIGNCGWCAEPLSAVSREYCSRECRHSLLLVCLAIDAEEPKHGGLAGAVLRAYLATTQEDGERPRNGAKQE